MWKNPLQTFAIGITMAVGVSLSACDNSKSDTVEESASGIGTEQAPEKESVQASPTPDGDLDGATADQGTPVSYDMSTWNSEKVKSLKIDDLDAIKPPLVKW